MIAEKKNIALLNLSSIKPTTDENIFYSVPHDRKTNVCFPNIHQSMLKLKTHSGFHDLFLN
jgi:hypothetical protein